MKTRTPEHVARWRAAHHAALESLRAPGVALSGLAIWRKLRRIEARAGAAATAQCNGSAYGGQPYRGEDEWDAFKAATLAAVGKVFGQPVPGLIFNGDPRGYAIKIDPDRGPVPEGLSKDWGGYGCLAAEIS